MGGDNDGGSVEEGEDSEGELKDGEKVKEHRDGEQGREPERERVKWATLFMFSRVEYLI